MSTPGSKSTRTQLNNCRRKAANATQGSNEPSRRCCSSLVQAENGKGNTSYFGWSVREAGFHELNQQPNDAGEEVLGGLCLMRGYSLGLTGKSRPSCYADRPANTLITWTSHA